MKDDEIPRQHHVSRYCGGATLLDGEVTAASFMLKANDEYLSVNWLEFLELNNRDQEIAEIRRVLGTKMKRGSTAKIAILRAGRTKDHVQQNSPDFRILRVLHRPDEPPDKPDPSHSGIFDTRQEEQLIAELISETVIETHTAK